MHILQYSLLHLFVFVTIGYSLTAEKLGRTMTQGVDWLGAAITGSKLASAICWQLYGTAEKGSQEFHLGAELRNSIRKMIFISNMKHILTTHVALLI